VSATNNLTGLALLAPTRLAVSYSDKASEDKTASRFGQALLRWNLSSTLLGGVNMERLHSTSEIIRKVALLTLLGFLVVFLIGPVLTVLGVVLPFALVGLLVWLPIRVFVQRREINWSGLPNKAGQFLRTVLAIPVRIVGFVLSAIAALLRLVVGAIGLGLRILLPAVAGALLFGVLGAIGGANHHDAEFRIPAAVLIGAGLGALYGAFKTKKVEKVIVLRPAPATAERV
jgi:hypothetical protein